MDGRKGYTFLVKMVAVNKAEFGYAVSLQDGAFSYLGTQCLPV